MRTGLKHQNAKVAILPKQQLLSEYLIMVLLTRLNPLRTPFPEHLAGREATTTRKCKFFDVLARDRGTKSIRQISTDYTISEACGRK